MIGSQAAPLHNHPSKKVHADKALVDATPAHQAHAEKTTATIYLPDLLIEFAQVLCVRCVAIILALSIPIDAHSDKRLADKLNQVTAQSARIAATYSLDKLHTDNITVKGLSGLAWDQDDQILYAVSDFGIVYHFAARFIGDQIAHVALIFAYPLRGKNNLPVTGVFNDAEGLEILNGQNGKSGDAELIVAFERQPRLSRYLPDGTLLGDIAVARAFNEKGNYHKPNKSLETVLMHKKFGLLLGSERPMSGQNPAYHKIFAKDGELTWAFKIGSHDNASFTGMVAMDNGDIIVLERSFESIIKPYFIALRKVYITDCESNQVCNSDTLLELNSVEHSDLENFEGLAKLDNRRYLMVSDDNANPLQETLLKLIVVE